MSTEKKKMIGIDVSSTDLCLSFLDAKKQEISKVLKNEIRDIERYLRKLNPEEYGLVVESTGSYSSRVVYLGVEQGFDVYVVNPLSIKRFAEMHNLISKTDEQDSRLIRKFGEMMNLKAYEPKSEELNYMEQEMNLWEDLEEEKRRFNNKIKALEYHAKVSPATKKQYLEIIEHLEAEIKKVLERLPKISGQDLKASIKLLSSIKGIGNKTAMLLLTATNGFKNFENAKALTKYFGVAPRLYHSGKKKMTLGKCRTSKNFVRSKLYVCSWSAIRSNKACKDLYERLLAKGKAKKAALIAVCGKLLRQAFGVIKNQTPYQPIWS
jgi:transposase